MELSEFLSCLFFFIDGAVELYEFGFEYVETGVEFECCVIGLVLHILVHLWLEPLEWLPLKSAQSDFHLLCLAGEQRRVGFKVHLELGKKGLKLLGVAVIEFRCLWLEDFSCLFSSLSYASVTADLLELL